MVRWSLAAAAVGLFAAAGSAGGDAAKEDLKKFEGTWAIVSATQGGEKVPKEKIEPVRVILKGNTYKIQVDDKVVGEGTFKLDPTKTPKWIDIMSKKADGKTSLGVYELKGDSYTICIAEPGEERPRALKSEPGSKHFLQTAKRVKE